MSRKEPVIGIFILAAGLFILLGKWGFFNFVGGTMWPLFLFLVGAGLVWLIRSRILPPIAFVPGGTLLVYGLLFMVCHWISWELFRYLWPFILIGLALGLYGYSRLESYPSPRAWQAAVVLGGAGILLLVLTLIVNISVYLIAFGLIVVGALLIFGGMSKIRR
ncbi:glutamate synthase [Paenibacillus sp. SC116]|uniref:glutamate synthase n=1 Tax=Paenibacillus sp. SC116 TaxID=2968986 RepID=UPI00215A1606|nr:glutamate synthase [Paenibacillus sp. SC116]MCR8845772.1 glutamate synthase [Paenibacillus sp. SC116]